MASRDRYFNANNLRRRLRGFWKVHALNPLVAADTLRLVKQLAREEPQVIPRSIESLVEPLRGKQVLNELYSHPPFLRTLYHDQVLRELFNADPLPPLTLLQELAGNSRALPLIMRACLRKKMLGFAAELLNHISPGRLSFPPVKSMMRVEWKPGTPVIYCLRHRNRLWWANHIVEWYEELMGLGVGNFHIHHRRTAPNPEVWRRLGAALSSCNILILSEPEAELYREYWMGDLSQWSQLEWVEPDQDPADLRVLHEEEREQNKRVA